MAVFPFVFLVETVFFSFSGFLLVFVFVAVVVVVESLLDRRRVLDTAFLSPALSVAVFPDFFSTFRFLFSRDVDSSRTLSTLRFVPPDLEAAVVVVVTVVAVVLADFFLGFDSWIFLGFSSFGLGPRTPRHVGAAHRHS